MNDETNDLGANSSLQRLIATYRLQFSPNFRFEDAQKLTRYLAALGISHLYSSPILRARPGSEHGYDVVDPAIINPELGGDEAFYALTNTLTSERMGILLDIVPNHMAVSEENPYWWDLLSYGRLSPFAQWFDLDWSVAGKGRTERLLLPVLGSTVHSAVQEGQLGLGLRDNVPVFCYFDRCFPLSPGSLPLVLRPLAESADSGELKELAGQLERKPPRRGFEDAAAEWREAMENARREVAGLLGAHEALRARLQEVAANGGTSLVQRLLARQQYSLRHWVLVKYEAGYRRFFDVNELVALRMELPAVFRATHERIGQLIAEGKVSGLRIDHIDGLLEPREYLDRLRRELTESHLSYPLYVEKILARDEPLPQGWPIDGATGYESLNDIQSVFVSRAGLGEIEAEYRKKTRIAKGFAQAELQGKRTILRSTLSPDVSRLARRLKHLAHSQERFRALSMPELRSVIIEVAAQFPVYRSYVSLVREETGPKDRELLEGALQRASENPKLNSTALSLLRRILLSAWEIPQGDPLREPSIDFVRRFQQLTAPTAAKGVEDTAFYRYVPLLALNEVGGGPLTGEHSGEQNEPEDDDGLARFHDRNRTIAEQFPATLRCLSTHDTKRSADVRARLLTLTEIPKDWLSDGRRWERSTRVFREVIGGRRLPEWNTVYMFLQTLVGIWPEEVRPDDDQRIARCCEELRPRMRECMLKSCREAKLYTSWIAPDQEYEDAVTRYVERALSFNDESAPFLRAVARFVSRIKDAGQSNALAFVTLNATLPGVPDTYQGDELWNFSLVDPDNRRPVDFEKRMEALERLGSEMGDTGEARNAFLQALLAEPQRERAKLFLLQRLLTLRQAHSALFLRGSYRPLAARGSAAAHVVAFAREFDNQILIVVVPRFSFILSGPHRLPLGSVWSDTRVSLPPEWAERQFTDRLSLRRVAAAHDGAGASLPMAELLAGFPAAVLTSFES